MAGVHKIKGERTMTDLEKLLAIEEIRQLRPKYFRLIDSKNFEELPSVFSKDTWFDSSDAICDPIKGQYPGFPKAEIARGRDAVVQSIIAGLPPALQSCHMCNVGEIEITSDTTAKGIIGLTDRLLMPGALASAGYGYYYDEYVKEDGKWVIAGATLKRKRVIFEDDKGNGV